MTLGEHLRQLRGFETLREVASRTGLSVSYLSDLERGRTLPSLNALARLADAFGLSTVAVLAPDLAAQLAAVTAERDALLNGVGGRYAEEYRFYVYKARRDNTTAMSYPLWLEWTIHEVLYKQTVLPHIAGGSEYTGLNGLVLGIETIAERAKSHWEGLKEAVGERRKVEAERDALRAQLERMNAVLATVDESKPSLIRFLSNGDYLLAAGEWEFANALRRARDGEE